MIDPEAVITALVVLLVTAGMFTLGAGIRRIPWSYGAIAGAGLGIVLTAFWAANERRWIDPATLVLVGALGGSLMQRALDRGERERRRISDEITSIRIAPLA